MLFEGYDIDLYNSKRVFFFFSNGSSYDFMKKRDEICFNNADPLKAIFLVLRFAVDYYSQANLQNSSKKTFKKRKILL